MSYIIEIVSKQGSGEPGASVSRRIIGEATSVASLRRLLSAEEGVDAEAVLVRRSDVGLDDEAAVAMLTTLERFDRYAIAVPRYSSDDSSLDHARVPFVTRTPLPEGPCVLLRMDIYHRFGPLDEGARGIEQALAAYGGTVNDAGFSTVVAENAIAFAASETPMEELGDENPFLIIDKRRYLGPFTKFADAAPLRKPKVLFDFYDMPAFYCGTSEYQMALIRYFREFFSDAYDVTIRCNQEAVEFHGVEEWGFEILMPHEPTGLFDVGLVAIQPISIDQQCFLNDHCLRIVYTMLDCIWLRSNYLCMEKPDVEDVARCGLRNCDGIIAISEFSRNDYLDYFSSDPVIQAKDSQVVYISTDFGQDSLADIKDEIPFERYDLVIGNGFKHKALKEVLAAVSDAQTNYVFVGLPADVSVPRNVISLPNTKLEEPFLDALYEHCDSVVFPSQYEGFGLPITIAFRHGKNVIACDNDLNHEIQVHFPKFAGNMLFFSSFDEIPALSAESRMRPAYAGELTDSWSGAIIQVESFLKLILGKPIDWFFMDQRQWQYRLLQEEMQKAEDGIGLKRALWRRFIKGHSARERFYRKLIYKEAGAED